MSEEKVLLNGVPVIPEWPQKVADAQTETHYEIMGQEWERIPYGQETRAAFQTPVCHDCAVLPGQLHVPGCDVEECRRCGHQWISCCCTDDEEEPG